MEVRIENISMEKQEQKIEKLEKEPKISYHIFYGFHTTPKDLENLGQAVEKADIYIPELVNWRAEDLEGYNQLSQGEITPEELAAEDGLSQKSNFFKEFQIIYNSKKPILFVDLPEGHELFFERREACMFHDQARYLFANGKFQPAIEKMREHIKGYGDYLIKRDEVIRANLEKKVKELIKGHPELKKKKEVKTLLALGVGHTPFYHRLKKEKLPVSREFSHQPMVFHACGEAERKLKFSKEIDKEVLARVFIEGLLDDVLQREIEDTNKRMMVKRSISSKLTFEEIAEISKELGKGRGVSIADCLKKRNIKVPETEQEIDEMLKVKNMTRKIPEIPSIHPPYEVEGPPKEARKSFYEFAKNRIKYLTNEEIIKWDKARGGNQEQKYPEPALYFISVGGHREGDNLEKWINMLEIVVNKDVFKINKKDYSDLIPFVLEHEICETWLRAKKGAGSTIDTKKQHILAHRKAFLLAEQQELGDKFLEWIKLLNPDDVANIKQCEYALQVAKKQLEHLKKKK